MSLGAFNFSVCSSSALVGKVVLARSEVLSDLCANSSASSAVQSFFFLRTPRRTSYLPAVLTPLSSLPGFSSLDAGGFVSLVPSPITIAISLG